MKKGVLSVILGTLAVLAASFAAMIICAMIAGWVINFSIRDSASFIILSIPTPAVFIAYFILFEVLFFKWQFRLSLEARAAKPRFISSNEPEPLSPEKFKKVSFVLTIIVICLCLAFPAIYINSHTRFDDEKITKSTLFTKKEYTTESVNGYSLLCDSEGMRYTISMKDGKSFELFNSDSLVSQKFNEKYESMFGYAAYLSDVYDSREKIVRKRVSGVERMRQAYENDHPDVWKYLEMIIADNE